jgi:hypothetical protein
MYAPIGTAGASVTPSTALSWDGAGNVAVATGDLSIGTAGKSLTLKTGVNACAGTFTLSGSTTTVGTSCAKTGDIILFTTSTVGGTPGFLSYTISNGVNFVATSTTGASDTRGESYVILHTN